MADDTKNATFRGRGDQFGGNTAASFLGANIVDVVVEVAAAANAGSVYSLCNLPSNAIIHGMSRVKWDDLASTGAPTVDIGITGDADAINDTLNVTAAGSADLLKDHANAGKPLWQVAGLSADPGGEIKMTASLVDAAANTGGTISACIVYSMH